MRRRRLLLGIVGMVALVVVVPGVLVMALYPKPVLTQAKYDQLHEGMTEQEVEAILGCSGKAMGRRIAKVNEAGELAGLFYAKAWEDDGFIIRIGFEEGVVACKQFSDSETFIQRLRRLLPW